MLLLTGHAIDEVDLPRGKRGEQGEDLIRAVLEVVVHRHDDLVLDASDPGEQSVVLAVVATQLDRSDFGVGCRELLGDVFSAVDAAVDDEHNLKRLDQRCGGGLGQRCEDRVHQGPQRLLGPVAGDDDTDAHRTRMPYSVPAVSPGCTLSAVQTPWIPFSKPYRAPPELSLIHI